MKTSKPIGSRAGFALLLAFGFLVTVIGVLALAGWILGLPRLSGFRAGSIPMAPSTAILFLLCGISIALRAQTPLSNQSFRICAAAGSLVALIATPLLALSALNIHLPYEYLGLSVPDKFGVTPVGHMSPVTAFCFLLASVSCLASLSRSPTRPWRNNLAFGAAALLLGTCFLFLLAYLYGAPLLYGGSFIPPALNTILAHMILGLALLTLSGWSARLFRKSPENGFRTAVVVVAVFILLTMGISAIGYRYYRSYEQHYRLEVEHGLSAIAELKVGELVQWRKDHMDDAAIFFKNPSFTALVRRFFEQPESSDTEHHLLDWLGKYASLDDYDQVRLMDTQGVTRLSIPAGIHPASSVTVRAATEALRTGQIAIQDFYRNDNDRRIHLSLLVPILDPADAHRPLGVLVIRIDPTTFIFPYIQHWPTLSKTAETLLIRRDGNDALFLNDLRHKTNAAFTLRVPLQQTDSPAVRAILGQTGCREGLDYRGAPVIADVQAIPDSPWFLVAKLDTSEVLAPMRDRLWQIVMFIGALLFAAAACVGLVWRQQHFNFYRLQGAAAESLRESEERHRTILQTAMDGVWMVDKQGRLLEVNESYCRMSGYSEPELLTMHVSDLETIEGAHETAAHIQRIIAQGEDRFESRHRRKDGRTFDIDVSVQYRAADGGMVAFIHDITRQKQTETQLRKMATESNQARLLMADLLAKETLAKEQLRKSEGEFRTLTTIAPVGIYLTDSAGDCLYANPAWCHMAGLSLDEALGKGWTKALHPEDHERVFANWNRMIESHGQWGQEYRFQSRENKVTWIYGLAAPQYDKAGNITQYVGINMDITDFKHAEEEKAKLEDQLAHAQKLESVGRLAGGVAHDFNNLLMGIMGYTDLCRDALPAEHPIRNYLDEITKISERSADFTRQLLTFARRQIIAPKVLNLNDAVAGMLNLLLRLIGEDIQMTWTPGSNLWPIKIDPSQLDQILTNLCINARDAIPGVGKISIETANGTLDQSYCANHPGTVPGEYVLLMVSDNGCGMEKDVLANIFEPFYTTKEVGKGTGLGLATVFGIVKQNNGCIDVYSEPGKGSTFKIYLPRFAGKNETPDLSSAVTPAPRGNGETILLVEDEPSLRITCGLFLIDLGYKVIPAGHPEEALLMLTRHQDPIHLLLTDIIMPGMNGHQLAEQLLATHPGIKVLFMSGYTADVIAQRGLLNDGVHFIQKPFSRDDLAHKVHGVLKGWQVTGH